MKFGDSPVSKNKLAILKKVHPLIYKTNRNKPNKLPSRWLSMLTEFLNVFKYVNLIHLLTV